MDRKYVGFDVTSFMVSSDRHAIYDRGSVLTTPQASKSWISNFGFSIGRLDASSTSLSCEHKPLALTYCQSASSVENFSYVESSTWSLLRCGARIASL
jgi:hypothetical protein